MFYIWNHNFRLSCFVFLYVNSCKFMQNVQKWILCFLPSSVTAHDVPGRCLQQPTTTSAAWESRTTQRWQVCVTFQLQPGRRLEYQWACGRMTAADAGWSLLHTEAESLHLSPNSDGLFEALWSHFYFRPPSSENGPCRSSRHPDAGSTLHDWRHWSVVHQPHAAAHWHLQRQLGAHWWRQDSGRAPWAHAAGHGRWCQ